MSAGEELYGDALEAAAGHARRWLESQGTRHVGPRATAADLAADFGGPLPSDGMPAAEVVDYLAAKAEPGLMAMPSGPLLRLGHRRHAARRPGRRLAGQRLGPERRAALRDPGHRGHRGGRRQLAARAARASGGVRRRLRHRRHDGQLRRPRGRAVARCMADAGWDLDRDGLPARPGSTASSGQERHDTIDLALRYLGLGRPTAVPADEQGRIIPAELDCALDHALDGVRACHGSGRAPGDRLPAGRQPALRRLRPASPRRSPSRTRTAPGCTSTARSGSGRPPCPLCRAHRRAASWPTPGATDAHKTLNVPYDCGIAVVRDAQALRSAMGVHTSYLIQPGTERAIRSRRSPSSPGGPAASRCGRR